MKKKIGFVAIGQAGGNIGKLFEDKGFTVLYLNTSREDLQTLKNAKYTYHIAGGEGCNKDRSKAKRLVMEDFDNISKEIYEKMDVSMIYVIFASGGGTGSGCGPMLIDLLLEDIAEGKSMVESVGAITVIPSEKESPKTQINCYECFEELTALDNIASVMAIDNAKGDKLILNQHLVNVFYNFIEIPNRHKDERGNIDRAEIEETLKSKGMLIVTEIPAKESSTAAVLESFKKSVFAPIEPDRVIKYISISIAGAVDVDAMRKEIGIPVDVFQTYNDKSTICCLSGLNYPKTRLEAVYDKATENQEQIIKNLQAVSDSGMKKNVNFLASAKAAPASESPKPKTSRRDLMKKYIG
ncbi:MAG: hypothetical protein NC345_13410 [Lachnospira sp.]|nr:hypothetical protein [Lachnospira sp.]